MGEACNLDTFMADVVLERHPGLRSLMKSCVVALNEEYVERENLSTTRLQHRDTVAIIPPISGG